MGPALGHGVRGQAGRSQGAAALGRGGRGQDGRRKGGQGGDRRWGGSWRRNEKTAALDRNEKMMRAVTKVVPAVTPEVKDSLVKNIRRRMTPQPLKIRADVEMKCFQFDGVLHIKQAMKKAEASGNDNCPVKIKLVAPPLYVLTTQTLDKEQGISVLTDAIKACTAEIEKYKGKLVVKEPPRAVSEREDKLFLDQINSLMAQNEEVDGDDDSEEEEDTGMGDVDLTNTGVTAY
ncbi:hypothetical protein C2845_PM02G29070 [Panicum miliaceum]|uniref:Eukaryotic translation initiation factor 2 subunit alpha-like n=1 Tax=Panicum miliaceum TaxID=4540 RepID=A0A3L6SGW9_PANMI|nr:hypothetical protein C2845_PM02G29070 [Panicum miliaceum]